MALTPAQLAELQRHLNGAVTYDDLTSMDWRRQTDSVRYMFIVARLFVDLGNQAVFVDGRIARTVLADALAAPGGVKGFFNRRCHDRGVVLRRCVFFDTVTTRKMGGRGSGKARLHFHSVFELPPAWSLAEFKRQLGKVFGTAVSMGQRQFDVSRPRWDQHYTHAGRQVGGPLGKINYALAHAGTTYRDLDLNEGGKRSRKAPAFRASCNRNAKGLARGIPSNFSAAAVLIDSISKRAGRQAFQAWIKAERALRQRADVKAVSKRAPRKTAV